MINPRIINDWIEMYPFLFPDELFRRFLMIGFVIKHINESFKDHIFLLSSVLILGY